MYTRDVFYYETDRMGIVHNSNYLRYFEEARLHYMKEIGIDYSCMEAEGILIPQTESYVKYHAPMHYGDTMTVNTILKEFNGIVMRFEYSITISNDSQLVTTGYTRHCFMDEQTRRPLSIIKKSKQIYDIFQAKRV